MKRSHRFLLAGSLFGLAALAGCVWVQGLFGIDPAKTAAIQEDAHRAARATADLMENLQQAGMYLAAYLGGMVTKPVTKMMAKTTMSGARKVRGLFKRKVKK